MPLGKAQDDWRAKRDRAWEESLPATRSFYFGTWLDAGHYMWARGMQRTWWQPGPGKDRLTRPVPWERIDGALNPRDEIQGECLHHVREGWTAVALADRTVDSRGGSNSIFFVRGELGFEEALAVAREDFPEIFERLEAAGIELRLVDKPRRRE